jgi:RimJ/RimL family protein N-acetyltransferase
MMAAAPTIETERLVLRAHRASDFDAVAAMWGDAEVARFIGGSPSTRQESWFRMLRYAGLWPMVGFGYWAIADRAKGRFLGDVGFADFQRGMPELDGVPEVGWALVPHAWGRGVATEAVQAVLAWSDASQPGHCSPARRVGWGVRPASRSLAFGPMKREIVEARYAETLAELNKARADAMAVLGAQLAESHARYVEAVEALADDVSSVGARHRAARTRLLEVRWKMTVQREAAGLADHSWLDHTYPLAPLDRRPDEPTEAQRRHMHNRLLR